MSDVSTGGFRLSPQQRRLWRERRRHGDSAFRARCAVRVTGELDAERLEAALRSLAQRHEILRTRFVSLPGSTTGMQVIDDEPSVHLDAGGAPGGASAGETDGDGLRATLTSGDGDVHQLELAISSLASDAPGLKHLARELFVTYRGDALCEPLQYPDLADWQNELLESEETEEGRAFWARATVAEAPELRAEPSRVAEREFDPERLRRPVDAKALRRIEEHCRERGIAPPAFVEACWLVVLARFGGERRNTVATGFDGRRYDELQGALGLLERYLPLTVEVDPDRPFRELAAEVDRARETAGEWQEFFGSEDNRFEGGGEAPISFAFVDYDLELGARVEGFDLRVEELTACLGPCALKVALLRRDGESALELTYDRSAIAPATAELILGRVDALIEDAAEWPERPVAELARLGLDERSRLVEETSRGPILDLIGELGLGPAPGSGRNPPRACLHELVAARAAERPDAVAAVFGDRCLTYDGLARRVHRLAHHLRSQGAEPGARVAVMLPRSLDMVVALLAVLTSGAAYVPLDPEYPPGRLGFMLSDSRSALLVRRRRDGALAGALAGSGAETVDLDADRAAIEGRPSETPEPLGTPDHLAYTIYTSGTTGTPKGVMVAHRAIANRLLWMILEVGFSEESSVLHKTPISFDASIWELFVPLIAGGRLLVAEPGAHRDVAVLLGAGERHRATDLQLVPSLLRAYLETRPFEPVGDLRRLFCGGEALPVDVARRIAETAGIEVHNLYGPTEASIDVTHHRVEASDSGPVAPLGRPIANLEVHLLTDEGRHAPYDEESDVFVGGAGLARGYAFRPGLTAERFVPHPWAETPGERLYDTGDRGRFRIDGLLEYAGRKDDQLKIRGTRVEPGEVEAALRRQPGVGEAVVTAWEPNPGDRRLAAYVIPSDGDSLNQGALRDGLADELPDALLPSVWTFLDTLPLTPGGKLDRSKLPAPAPGGGRGDTHEPPRTSRERLLADIWIQVLGAERVGVRDDFFKLGGDSILSLQIVALAARQGLKLSVQQLFEHRTIERLAGIAGLAPAAAEGEAKGTGEVPLTPIQRRFFELTPADPHHWNQSLVLDLPADASHSALAGAARRVVERHDALRAHFVWDREGWTQEIAREASWEPLLEVDLGALPADRRPDATVTAGAAAQAGFELARGGLFRALIFRGAMGSSARLLLIAHHLVVDGVSWRILLEDLELVYRALAAGEPPELPLRTVSYKRWAEALGGDEASVAVEPERSYWEAVLDTDPAPLPGAPHEPDENTERSMRQVTVTLDPSGTERLLRELPELARAQVEEVLLSALAVAVSEWSGQPRVFLDLESHGREIPGGDFDLSRTVGWFTAVFPVELEVPESGDPLATLRATKERLREVPGRGVGFGVLGYAEASQISFNYLGRFDRVLAGSELFEAAAVTLGPARSPNARRTYLLDLNAAVVGDRLEVTWSYCQAVHGRDEIEALADRFRAALGDLVEAGTSAASVRAQVPSDFPSASLEPEALAELIATVPDLEELYLLTPVQQGMLLQTLRAPEAGSYCSQIGVELKGDLDVVRLRGAFDRLLERHAVLRTSVHWQALDRPHQAVRSGVRVPWTEVDARGDDPQTTEERFHSMIRESRTAGFDLTVPPLARMALLRVSDHRWRIVLTQHHLVLDGWSMAIVLRDLLALYDGDGDSLGPAPRPFRDYVEFLRQQDDEAGADFWRRALAGISRPTPVGIERDPDDPELPDAGFEEIGREVDAGTVRHLEELARTRGLTMSTVLQGVWARFLAHQNDSDDVIFGTTVSGRPPELRGVEDMVGVFINTLPVRVRLDREERALDFMEELQRVGVEARRFETTPLVAIHGWSEVPRDNSLFESIFVYESYPVPEMSAGESTASLKLEQRWSLTPNHYPFTLRAVPGDSLRLIALIDRQRYDRTDVSRVLEHLVAVLDALAAMPRIRLGDLPEAELSERRSEMSKTSSGGSSSFANFKSVKPQAVGLDQVELVERSFLAEEQEMPLVLTAQSRDVDLVEWAKDHRDRLDEDLHRCGSILFRGFGVSSGPEFQRFAETVCEELFEEYGDLPKGADGDRIYGATPYPPEKTIRFHNEASHTHRWPLKQMFYCDSPAPEGGESAIVDGRRVLEALDPELRDRFVERALLYVRNFTPGLDVSWQDFFRTHDRSLVEEYCRKAGIEYEWKGQNGLRTSQRAPAVVIHPVTGEEVWFNQVQLHHISCVEGDTGDSLLDTFEPDDLPRNVYYGDGSPIEDETVAVIGEALAQEATVLRLEQGEVLLVDNMLVAHSRLPYSGPRKILVAMGDTMTEVGHPQPGVNTA